jgi:hypothetical protein
MKTEIVIKCEIDNLEFGYFDENDNYIELSSATLEEDAKELGVSAAMVNALHFFAEDLSERLHIDLASIWKRLDKLES